MVSPAGTHLMVSDATAIEPAPGGAAPFSPGRRRRSRLHVAQRRAGIIFALPVIAPRAGLPGHPARIGRLPQLHRWDGLTSTWIGLGNYERLFGDPTFWRIVLNNLFLLAAVPIAILIPLLVAYLLNEHVAGWQFFRSAYFLPTAISWVVIGMVAIRFFAGEGILNTVLETMGLGGIRLSLLGGETSAMVAVIITFIWSVFGTNTIIFITGMATLDRDIYEAARVDGAGSFTLFWKITIPMLMRFIQFAFILTLITAFTALFSLIFVMTGGGPGYGTTTLEFYVYQQGFTVGVFGYAAAIGIVLFAVVFAISLAQLRLFKSRLD